VPTIRTAGPISATTASATPARRARIPSRHFRTPAEVPGVLFGGTENYPWYHVQISSRCKPHCVQIDDRFKPLPAPSSNWWRGSCCSPWICGSEQEGRLNLGAEPPPQRPRQHAGLPDLAAHRVLRRRNVSGASLVAWAIRERRL
jgi:hypothetical protein